MSEGQERRSSSCHPPAAQCSCRCCLLLTECQTSVMRMRPYLVTSTFVQ